ncbi:phage major capsid protein, P2 family [Comamonas terrigena]|uniref:phage major capsid protein, P2 family n=1 Tax=Comamonas terrigena TaxID=32013 RepID=UPI0028A1BC3F|nr:phage major capsid protein, P2 family [Comamonas terrigena]
MRNETRQHFTGYMDQQARNNGVGSAADKFNVAPSVQQKLESKLQESSDFLGKINIIGVAEMKGEKLGLGVNGTIAGRTDTSGNKSRQTQDATSLSSGKYECVQTDYDTHIRYATLDAWAKFKDFQTRISDQVLQRCALDRIMIGWNGTHAADDTDRVANPLLQDVNIGWLEHIRTSAPERVVKEGAAAGKVTIGPGGDFAHLDALVYDATKTLLDPWYQEDPQLVAILGRDLMHDKLFPLVEKNDAPTERLAADIVVSQRRLGGLPAVVVPYFPAGTVLITRLDNLSIYYQDGARRRGVKDAMERNRIEFYESSNDAFVVEKFGQCALVENIESINP